MEKKFSEISKQIGSRLMKTLGFESKDENINVFPSAKVINEINTIQNVIINKKPSQYRVVPDPEDKKQYCIVLKENNKYTTFEKGFKNRFDAQKRLKHINDSHKLLSPLDAKETLKRRKD